MPSNDAYKIQLLVGGDENTGKSSLVRRFMDNQPPSSNQSEVLNVYKTVEYGDDTVDFDVTVCTQFTLKNQSFNQLCAGKNACLLCFDRHAPDAILHLENWIARLRDSPAKSALIVLASTKHEDAEAYAPTPPAITTLMAKYGIHHYEQTSAITGHGISSLFETIAKTHIAKEEASHSEQEQHTVYKCRRDFLNKHRLKMNKKLFSIFSRTKITATSSLEDMLESARREDKNTRSKPICIELGWLNKDGTLHENAPEPVKEAYHKVNRGSSLSL